MVSKLPEHVGTTCNCISSLHAAGTGMWRGRGGGGGGGTTTIGISVFLHVCTCYYRILGVKLINLFQ